MSSVRSSCYSVFAALLFFTASAAGAADEQKIIRLEQDVRKLERIVQDQARQIEDLRRQLGRPDAPSVPDDTPRSAEPSSMWLSAEGWARVHPGMSELEVLSVLGPPTQLRSGDDGSRVLLYALEIGASGFLSGTVTMKDGKVTGTQRPALR